LTVLSPRSTRGRNRPLNLVDIDVVDTTTTHQVSAMFCGYLLTTGV
jgi:hypothetical protein